MIGTMNIEMVGEDFKPNPNRSPIKRGPLTLPDGTVCGGGDLIAFGENDTHLHCVTSAGAYVGIFKSNDTGHIWGAILLHNAESNGRASDPTRTPCYRAGNNLGEK